MNPVNLADVIALCAIRTMAVLLVPFGWGFDPIELYGTEHLYPPMTFRLSMKLQPGEAECLLDLLIGRKTR